MKKISLVISSYRGNEDLVLSCIASLEQQMLIPDEVFLVVDTPEEREAFSALLSSIRKITLHILSSGKKGLAPARNCGVDASSGEIIAFIDDDATADPRWLSEIEMGFSSHPDVVVVGGPVYPVFEGRRIDEKWNWIIGCTSRHPPTTRPVGCNMAIAREVFGRTGGFDEGLGRIQNTLSIGEETEVFLRIREMMPGSRIICNPKATVFHRVPHHRTTLRYMMKRAYQEGIGKAVVGRTHDLGMEKTFLRYYLTHPDRHTIPVLFATGIGFLRGRLTGQRG